MDSPRSAAIYSRWGHHMAYRRTAHFGTRCSPFLRSQWSSLPSSISDSCYGSRQRNKSRGRDYYDGSDGPPRFPPQHKYSRQAEIGTFTSHNLAYTMSLIAESFIALLGLFLRVVCSLLLCCLFLPICLVVFTPYLVIAALFSEESYLDALISGYYNVYSFWRDYIVVCSPL